VAHLVSNLVRYDQLVDDIAVVLNTLIPKELEVEAKDGAWHLMHIRPYRTQENVIEGAVVTFVDITARKRIERSLAAAHVFADSLVSSVRELLVVLDDALRVVVASRAFYALFETAPNETEGRLFFELSDGHWDVPALRQLLIEVTGGNPQIDGCEIVRDFSIIGRRKIVITTRQVRRGQNLEALTVLSMELLPT
jgi:two-component system CheB/CheR fusion protein